MSDIYLLNKPYNVLSTFTDKDGRGTLANFIDIPDIYAAGRLDYDSEGLVLLTADGDLQHRLANPKFKLPKTYWVQVEGEINDEALIHLSRGVELKDGRTRPAQARRISEPNLWPRSAPIRQRKNQPTSWLELIITEGKNRQVRRMTAAVGFPTLRLIRVAIGNWQLDQLQPGDWRREQVHLPTRISNTPRNQKTDQRVGTKPRGKGRAKTHSSHRSKGREGAD